MWSAMALLTALSGFAASGEPPAVSLRPGGTMLVDGQPFFPLGIYLGPTEDEDLSRIAEAGFNTILCYRFGASENSAEYLDKALRHGLKVVYSLKDFYEGTPYFPKGPKSGLEWVEEKVLAHRQHPALLAWYVNDELEPEWIEKIRRVVAKVKSLDPNHPTIQVLCSPRRFGQYRGVTDILAVDPYPIPERPITLVSEWADKAIQAMEPGSPVWLVPQMFDWRIYRKLEQEAGPPGPPTLQEMRIMTALALIHQARGLIFYSYFDLQRGPGEKPVTPELFHKRWEEIRTLLAEIRPMLPALATGPTLRISGFPEHLHVAFLGAGDQAWMLAVNSDRKHKVSAEVSAPAYLLFPGGGLTRALSLDPLSVLTLRMLPAARKDAVYP